MGVVRKAVAARCRQADIEVECATLTTRVFIVTLNRSPSGLIWFIAFLPG